MKIGVSSYCFHKLVASGKMDQLDVIAKAKEIGFDVIEFAALQLKEGETPISLAPRIREEAERVGIEIGNYSIGANFLNGDWEAEADRLIDTELEAAALMGAPGMRHDVAYGIPEGHSGPRGFDDFLPTLALGCRRVSEAAAERGIRTMMENHGFFAQDSERVEKLMNEVNYPNFGWLVDMGNFLCADENPEKAVARAMPYAFHVHAKDFHVKSGMLPDPGTGWFRSRGGNYLRGAIIGHGDVPVLQCLGIMKRSGYQGVLSLEFEGMEDPLLGIQLGYENLHRFVDML